MRPLLLGMNNPLSDDPEFDLYPYPEGSAGHRLWKLLGEGISRSRYLAAFDRRNILRAREWNAADARAAAATLLPDLVGRTVVVLGTQARSALGLPKVAPLIEQSASVPGKSCMGRMTWVALPHPSGRNLWYNSPENRARAGGLLMDLMLRAEGEFDA